MRRLPFPHPGEILLEEFLKPMGISQYRVAKAIGVPAPRIGEIVAGRRSITADTGLRLSRYFGLTEWFWTGLQADYDREMTRHALAATLAAIVPFAQEGKAPTPAPRRASVKAVPAKRRPRV